MRRCLITLLILTAAVLQVWAQRERNNIYILDCSRSMLTDYKVDGRPLWDATLDYLQAEVNRQMSSSTINIVPFQGSVYDVTSCRKQDFDWTKFREQVKDYPQTLTGTNICAAWDRALTLQDPNKDNYIILLTDGEDNKQGVDAVCRRIREWCEKVRNTYGYYVMLSNDAMNPKIVAEVERCKNMFLVNAKDGIRPFGSVGKTDLIFNTLEPKDVMIPFSAAGTFKAHIECDDPNFEVRLVDNCLKDGRGVVRITPKGDLTLLDKVLRLEPKLVGEDVTVLNPELNLIVNNQPERLLSLANEEQDLGKAEWYDSFLWKAAKPQDTLTVDLQAAFNQAAIEGGSAVKLTVKSRDKEGNAKPLSKDLTLLWNGQPVTDGTLTLTPGQPSRLGLVFANDATEGKHYLEITTKAGSAVNLERINEDAPSDYLVTMRASYDVDTNPLKVFLIWLGIIVAAALLLWFLLLKPLLFPTIKLKSLTIECSPVYKNTGIKGYRKVVFSNKRHSQGLLSCIFTGEVKYVKDDIWDSEWYLTPSTRRDRVRANGISGYSMNPPGNNLQMHETVTMKSNSTGQLIKVTPK